MKAKIRIAHSIKLVNRCHRLKLPIDNGYTIGYTLIMKTAISIDKDLYEEAENYSRAAGLSRSKLYCEAVREYIQNYNADTITEKLNSYYDKHDSRLDDDIKKAGYRLLDGEDW